MKSVSYDYIRATDLDTAIKTLSELGDEGRALAGGQSLLPLMRMRFLAPSVLVDIRGLGKLRHIGESAGEWSIGSLVTHYDIERGMIGDPLRGKFAWIGKLAGEIGHLPIRFRGTVGGSIAQGDPTAEWVAFAYLTDAEISVSGSPGIRRVSIHDFYETAYSPRIENGELVSAIHFKLEGWSGGFVEYSRRAGDFALAAVGVLINFAEESCAQAKIVFSSPSRLPIRLTSWESALDGWRMGEIGDLLARIRAVSPDLPKDLARPNDDTSALLHHRLESLFLRAIFIASRSGR